MAPGGPRPAKRVRAGIQGEQPTRVSARLLKTRQSTTTPTDEDKTEEQVNLGPNVEDSPVRDWSYEGPSHQPTCDMGMEPSSMHDAQGGDGVDNNEQHTQPENEGKL